MQKSSTKHEHTDSNNTLEGPHTMIKHVWTQPPASPFRTVSPKRHSVWGPEGFTCRTESPVILPWDADKTPDSGAERAAGTPEPGRGAFSSPPFCAFILFLSPPEGLLSPPPPQAGVRVASKSDQGQLWWGSRFGAGGWWQRARIPGGGSVIVEEADVSNGRREDAISSRWARIAGLQVGDVRAQAGGGWRRPGTPLREERFQQRQDVQLPPDGSLHHHVHCFQCDWVVKEVYAQLWWQETSPAIALRKPREENIVSC